jgi:anaerobic dimethyl sulfoxide reductase subunit A
MGPLQAVVKNGVVIGTVPEDIVNPTIGREDAYLSQEDLQNGRLRGMPWGSEWVLPWLVNAPTRILYPMMRTGPRADPNNANFVRITWDQAVSIVVSQIQNCKAKYGAYSVETGGVCADHNEPWLIDYGVACNGGWGCASVAHTMLAHYEVLGNPYSTGGNITDLPSSKLIVLWSFDPTAGNMMGYRSWLRWLSFAKEQGVPIIVIDVKYTNAAQTFADQWIPIRPCTDLTMMLAVANVMFKNNLYDTDFVSKYVEPNGFQNWKDYVLGNTAGPDGAIDRTPEWAAKICGVPADTITAFAELYASSKPTCSIFGIGGGRQTRGVNQCRAAICLQAMTGNIGILGGSTGGDGFITPFNGVTTPYETGSYGNLEGGFTLNFAVPFLHCEVGDYDAILERDDYQSGNITQEQYYQDIGNNINNPAPNIHMLWLADGADYPGSDMVNVNRGIQAIQALDFFVVGARQMAGFFQLADLVLPNTEVYEGPAQFETVDRGWAWCQQLVTPLGESLDYNWFRMQVANSLGTGANFATNYFNAGMQNLTYDQWGPAMNAVMQQNYEAWASATTTTASIPNPPSWNDLTTTNSVIRADVTYPQPIPYAAQISGSQKFGTPSGLIEFYDSRLAVPFDASQIQAFGYFGIGAPIAPMPMWEPPEETYFDPKAATYPLVMRDTHTRYKWSCQAWSDPMINGEVARHAVWMNPADAVARGIVDGDQVEVFNDRGTISLLAYVTSRQTPGSVFVFAHSEWMPNQEMVDQLGCSNVLNLDSMTIAQGGQEATNALVDVRLANTNALVVTRTTTSSVST